jgi:AcrR family transcriptional regulator
MKRGYDQTARAQKTAETAERILDAALRAFAARDFDDVRLEDVAADADTTVQTVLRRFGGKEALFDALVEREAPRVDADRAAPVDDPDGAIAALVAHYEKDGDMVLRFLAQEHRVPRVRAVVRQGRAVHRAWCARCFDVRGDDRRLDAFVAATDLFVWKLLRRDLGRSRTDVEHTMRALVAGLAREAP